MPKVIDHNRFREELLDRCFAIFSQKGYSEMSIREIAREASVSTGTLYHYFQNKEDILEQMFSYIRRKNFGKYRKSVENIEKIEDRLKIITDFWKNHIEEYQNLLLLAIDYLRTKPSSKACKVFHDFTDFYIHALSDTLRISVQGTTLLFTYLIGLVLNSLLIPNIIKPNEQILLLYEILQLLTGKNTFITGDTLNELKTHLSTVANKMDSKK